MNIIPNGLSYNKNSITDKLANEILVWLKKHKNLFKKVPKNSHSILEYGKCKDSSFQGYYTKEFPYIIQKLMDTIKDIMIPDQCLINQYLPGEGIISHIDNKVFGNKIICFTFCEQHGRYMLFNNT